MILNRECTGQVTSWVNFIITYGIPKSRTPKQMNDQGGNIEDILIMIMNKEWAWADHVIDKVNYNTWNTKE